MSELSPTYVSDRLQARTALLQIASPQVTGDTYSVPHVELLAGPPAHPGLVLSWSSLDFHDSGTGGPSPACLDAFVRLAVVPEAEFPSRVLQYARKWGPLRTCRHGMPLWHSRRQCMVRGGPGEEYVAGHDGVGWFWEPLEPWRRYSRHLLAIERLAVDLQDGCLGAPTDWKDFEAGNAPSLTGQQLCERYGSDWWDEFAITRPDFHDPGNGQASVDVRKSIVEHAIDVWFRYGDIRPRTIWWSHESSIEIRMGGAGLVGALAMQLAANLSDRVYICAGCTYPFRVPDSVRRPAFNTRKWCDQCGRRAQWKNYQRRRYQARKTSSQENHG